MHYVCPSYSSFVLLRSRLCNFVHMEVCKQRPCINILHVLFIEFQYMPKLILKLEYSCILSGNLRK